MKSPESLNFTSSRQPKPVEWRAGRVSSWRGGKLRLLEQGGVNIIESLMYHSLVDPKSWRQRKVNTECRPRELGDWSYLVEVKGIVPLPLGSLICSHHRNSRKGQQTLLRGVQ